MTNERSPLADYLHARRSALQPGDVGLEAGAGRRVPGLRREEVADLAGISADYYLRIEQGRDHSPSDQVLYALSRALRLDDSERAYFFRLARPRVQSLHSHPLSSSVLQLLDYWADTPAYVFDRNQDVLASNQLMRALSPGVLEPGANLILDTFAGFMEAQRTDASAAVLAGWESVVSEMLAALRFYSDADDPRLQHIVGELSVKYRSFRAIWARHEARPHSAGTVRVHVDPIGWVEFDWHLLEIATAPGQYLVTYLAEPGTKAAAALAYLVSLRRPGRTPVRSDQPSA